MAQVAGQRLNQCRLLAADVGPGAVVGVELDREVAVEDVRPDDAGGPAVAQCFLEGVGGVHVLAADVVEDEPGVDGVGGDERAFDDLVGVALYQLAVFERARL